MKFGTLHDPQIHLRITGNRQRRKMDARNRIGYVSTHHQPEIAVLQPFPPISDKLDALGEDDKNKRSLQTPEFKAWCTSERHNIKISGPGEAAQTFRKDVVRVLSASSDESP